MLTFLLLVLALGAASALLTRFAADTRDTDFSLRASTPRANRPSGTRQGLLAARGVSTIGRYDGRDTPP